MLLKELRKENKLNLSELAEKSGVSVSYLCKIEKGLIKPSSKMYFKIKKALGDRDFEFRSRTQYLEDEILMYQSQLKSLEERHQELYDVYIEAIGKLHRIERVLEGGE